MGTASGEVGTATAEAGVGRGGGAGGGGRGAGEDDWGSAGGSGEKYMPYATPAMDGGLLAIDGTLWSNLGGW
jgi:hypothetical protein